MRKQQDERQKFMETYQKQKTEENKLKRLEKEEDLRLLRSYNPFGKPGFGAPRVGKIIVHILMSFVVRRGHFE